MKKTHVKLISSEENTSKIEEVKLRLSEENTSKIEEVRLVIGEIASPEDE